MRIRQVRKTELDELLDLINSYVLDPSKITDKEYLIRMEANGFLLGKLDKSDIVKMLERVFLVVVHEKKIIGYLRIDEEIDKDLIVLDKAHSVDWIHSDFKKYYYSNPHFEIGGVLVSKDFSRKNIGAELIYKGMEKLKYRNIKYIFSFVPIFPVRNEPSLRFHLKNGFKIIAKVNANRLWDINNYQSLLLMKESEWV